MLTAEQFSISLFPACGISGSDRLLSLHTLFSVQAGSVFPDMKFSRTLMGLPLCHEDSFP